MSCVERALPDRAAMPQTFGQKMKRALKWIGRILGALVLVAVLGFAWMVYNFNKALEPIESVSKYEEVLAD